MVSMTVRVSKGFLNVFTNFIKLRLPKLHAVYEAKGCSPHGLVLVSGLAYSAQAKRCYKDKTVPLHEKDDIEGIQGLMTGKLSVDEFRIVSGTKSPRINERNTGRAGKQPLHRLQPGEATHSADLPQPPPRPPLSLLGSVQRHNMVAVIEKLETMSVVSVAGDDNFEGGGSDATVKRPTNQWRLPSKETRRLTIELLESKCYIVQLNAFSVQQSRIDS